jgi:hypothetical protein
MQDTVIRKSFEEEWIEAIYADAGYLALDKMARSHGIEEDELKQCVAVWWWHEGAALILNYHQDNGINENYVVKAINNQAKRIAGRLQANKWEETGNYHYTSAFIRKHKYKLADAFGQYTLASEAHAVYVDFDKALGSLTSEEQDIFLTHPADYPQEEKANASYRRKVSKLTKRMERLMNNEYYNRKVESV